MKAKINYYKILKLSLIPINLFLILTFILNYTHLLPTFWKSIYVFYFSLIINITFATIKIKQTPYDLRHKSSLVYLSKYFFFLSIMVLLINQFLKREIVRIFNPYIFGLSVAFGFITFYLGKRSFDKVIRNDKAEEEIKEERSRLRFRRNANIVGRIWGLKSLAKFISKEGWFYFIGLIVIIVVSLYLRLKDIGKLSLWFDEALSVFIAKGVSLGLGDTLLTGWNNPRADLYHHLLGYLLRLFPNFDITARAFNIPFFIITVFLCYYLGKTIGNKKIGLLSSFTFSFSWISIAMFREARFYEFFLSIYLAFNIILLLLLHKYLRHEKSEGSKHMWLNWKTLLMFISLLLLGIIGLDTHDEIALFLYPLFFLGVFVFLANRNIKGILISIVSFIFIVFGLFINYKDSFRWRYLIQIPPLDWKSLTPKRSLFEFFTYLINNQYSYLYLILIISLIIVLIKIKDIKLQFIVLNTAILYLVIANQGYGIISIRYFYILLPFLSILISYSLISTMSFFYNENKVGYYIVGILFFWVILSGLYFSIQESNSIQNNNSLIEIKNNNYHAAFEHLRSYPDYPNSTIITDGSSSIPYYLFFDKTPDFIILDNSIIQFDASRLDPYLNVTQIDYHNLENIKGKKYVLIWHSPSYISDDFIRYLNSKGTRIFKERNKVMYVLDN